MFAGRGACGPVLAPVRCLLAPPRSGGRGGGRGCGSSCPSLRRTPQPSALQTERGAARRLRSGIGGRGSCAALFLGPWDLRESPPHLAQHLPHRERWGLGSLGRTKAGEDRWEEVLHAFCSGKSSLGSLGAHLHTHAANPPQARPETKSERGSELSKNESSKPVPLRKTNPTPENTALPSLLEVPPPRCHLAAPGTGKLDLPKPGLGGRAGLVCDQLGELGPVTEPS